MDRAEAGLRAQTGEKPGGGYYTGTERITLQKFSLGRITTLPRTVFGGRVVSGGGGGAGVGGGGGGAGATTGAAIVVRPQVSLVDRAQDLRIQTTQQSVGGIQQSLDVIRVQVTELNQGVQNTAKLLQAESALEQNQLKQEQEQERRLAERKIRLGKESALERGIQAALARPILKLQQTITSLFDRIMGSLTTLFFGWLTNQGIETLKALTEGDSKKLEEIKNNVIKNVLYAIGAFAAVKIGFGLLMRTITGLTLRLTGLVARIALAPFRLAASAIGGLLGLGKAALKAPAKAISKVPITASGGKVLSRSGGVLNKFLGGVRGLGNIFKGGGAKTGAKFVPGLGTLISGAAAAYDFSKGDIPGGLLNVVGMIPGPVGWLGTAGRIGLEGKRMMDGQQPPASTPTKAKVESSQPQTPPPTPTAQPQTPAMPPASEMKFSVDTANMLQAPAQPLAQETAAPSMMLNVDGLIQEKPAANMQAPPKPATPVGTLPEAKPNIIMARGGRDRTQTIAAQQEPLTDVPFIPSSNTDNFYVLYSQMNYNVVM
jgi:hypothetical protein